MKAIMLAIAAIFAVSSVSFANEGEKAAPKAKHMTKKKGHKGAKKEEAAPAPTETAPAAKTEEAPAHK